MNSLKNWIIVVVITLFTIAGIFAQSTGSAPVSTPTKKEDHYCDIDVQVKGKGKKLNNAIVEVNFRDNIFPFYTNSSGKCKIHLPLDFDYTLTVTYEGYFSKIIYLDTHVPAAANTRVFLFDFSVDLLEKVSGIDPLLFEKPVGRIKFVQLKYDFDFDEKFMEQVGPDMKVLNEKYEKRKKQIADSLKHK